ncbi:MAG TPA: PKD domain-containing protein [Bacteroidales bacterium]|nr:PKD domain-containing protein [Bacteroidales bacterium]
MIRHSTITRSGMVKSKKPDKSILKGSGLTALIFFLLFIPTAKNMYGCWAEDPDADFSANTTTPCVGQSVTFTDNSDPGTYTITSWNWSFGSGASPATATGKGPHNVSYTSSGSKNVALTVHWSGSNSNTETKNGYITANALPTPTISPAGAVCANSAGNVYTTQASMSNYSWTVTGGTITAGGTSNSNTVTVTWGAAGTGHVKVNYSNASGCSAASPVDQSITINALPAPSINPVTMACENSAGNVYTTQPLMSNYSWTVTGGTITAGGTSTSNTATVTWGAAGTGHIKVNYTNANGCSAASPTDQAITIGPSPAPAFIAQPVANCCMGENETYTTEPGQSNYSWNIPGTSGIDYAIVSGGIGLADNTVTLRWLTPGVKTVTVNYSTSNGCQGASAASSTVISNYSSLLWKGGDSSDPDNWNLAGNWQVSSSNTEAPPAPPCECTDVIVPRLGSGSTNYPTIVSGSGAVCNNLTIKDGASLIGNEYLTIKGVATVEKTISEAGWYWHFLSSPVESQDIWSQFTPVPNGNSYSNWNWPVSGINWDFYYYNPKVENVYPNVPWVNIRKAEESGSFPYNSGTVDDASPNGTGADAGFGPAKPVFTVGRGYLAAYNSGYSPSTHYFTGVLNSGDVYPGTVTASSFYLVGNPYSSSIDWEHSKWETSANPAVNHRNGLECSDGTYDFWVFRDGASGGNYLAGNSGGTYSSGLSKDIAPMQGFFVLTKQGGGLFEITNSVRVHSSQSWVKSAAVQNNVLRLELTTNKNSYRDEVMIDFNDQYSGEGGSYKFGSLYYDAPELWSVKNGNNYTINRYKEITPGLAVNISAKCGVDGTYTLTATNISDFSLSDIVYLEDLKTGTKVDLKAVGSYSFAGSPNDNKERFRVTFAEIAGAGEPGADKPVYIYSYENEVYINASRPETGNCAVYIYDALGRVIYRGSYDPVTGNQRFTTLSTPGAYIVKVVSGSGIVTAKIVIP